MEEIDPKIKVTKVIDLEKEVFSSVAQFLIGATISVAVAIVVFGGILLAQKNTLKKLPSRIKEIDGQLIAFKKLDEQLRNFSQAVANIEVALNQRQQWSPVLKELNRVTPKDVVYTSFSGEENKISLSGATPSLSSLAKLLVALGNSQFQNVTLSSIAINQGNVSFSIALNRGKQ